MVGLKIWATALYCFNLLFDQFPTEMTMRLKENMDFSGLKTSLLSITVIQELRTKLGRRKKKLKNIEKKNGKKKNEKHSLLWCQTDSNCFLLSIAGWSAPLSSQRTEETAMWFHRNAGWPAIPICPAMPCGEEILHLRRRTGRRWDVEPGDVLMCFVVAAVVICFQLRVFFELEARK